MCTPYWCQLVISIHAVHRVWTCRFSCSGVYLEVYFFDRCARHIDDSLWSLYLRCRVSFPCGSVRSVPFGWIWFALIWFTGQGATAIGRESGRSTSGGGFREQQWRRRLLWEASQNEILVPLNIGHYVIHVDEVYVYGPSCMYIYIHKGTEYNAAQQSLSALNIYLENRRV